MDFLGILVRTPWSTHLKRPRWQDPHHRKTSEPSNTSREGTSNEQKHKRSRNRHKNIKYRNRKRSRDTLVCYNHQAHRNITNSDKRVTVDEEGANSEINGSETVVGN